MIKSLRNKFADNILAAKQKKKTAHVKAKENLHVRQKSQENYIYNQIKQTNNLLKDVKINEKRITANNNTHKKVQSQGNVTMMFQKTKTKKELSTTKEERKQQFKDQKTKKTLNRTLNLIENNNNLLRMNKERIQLWDYLQYFSNQINKDKNTKQIVKYQTLFRCLLLFDLFMTTKPNNNLPQDQILLVAQSCMVVASKIQDIYHIQMEQLEHSQNRLKAIKYYEYQIIKQLNQYLYCSTEVDVLGVLVDQLQLDHPWEMKKLVVSKMLGVVRQYQCRQFTQEILAKTIIVAQLLENQRQLYAKWELGPMVAVLKWLAGQATTYTHSLNELLTETLKI